LKGRVLLERSLQRIWYRGHWASLALLPLAWIYGAVVRIRRLLYQQGLRRSYSVGCPVVIVGNITAGGTGKTPLVIWLASELSQRGLRPGVASRGYGAADSDVLQLVDEHSDPALVGDEPVIIARRTGASVVVGKDRVAVARKLAKLGVDVVICDDGLQHYRLDRDVEVAVVDGGRRLGNRRLLPAGPLREPATRLSEMDVVVNNGGLTRGAEIAMSLHGEVIINMKDGRQRAIESLAGERWHAVAGIGNPERFFAMLERGGLRLVRHPFPDHARFSQSDLEFADGEAVLMTEKDAVKCMSFAPDNCWYLPVSAELADAGEKLLELIISRCRLTATERKP
jgi:tetraacyldisaccharide 4'-kinase